VKSSRGSPLSVRAERYNDAFYYLSVARASDALPGRRGEPMKKLGIFGDGPSDSGKTRKLRVSFPATHTTPALRTPPPPPRERIQSRDDEEEGTQGPREGAKSKRVIMVLASPLRRRGCAKPFFVRRRARKPSFARGR
jgi:hypothetical protein